MRTITRSTHVPDHELYPELAGGDKAAGFELASIRPEDLSIAVETLIGNYSDPVLAVVRELVINALDSHREAGQSEPVEVRLPNESRQTFEVIDRGLGLSPTDMISVFTHPAASTKRGNAIATGELGIGAKAPFTVTDRFEVIGVKDGVRATLVMARIDDQLMHKIVEVTQSDEPDGVHVIVPTQNSAEARNKWAGALSTVQFWTDEPAAVVPLNLDGGREEHHAHWNSGVVGAHSLNRFKLDRSRWNDHVRPGFSHDTLVRMGQIAYTVPANMAARISAHEQMLYIVPNKTLRVAPNRESIVDDEANEAVLRELYDQWLQEMIGDQLAILADPALSPLIHARAAATILSRNMGLHTKLRDCRTRGRLILSREAKVRLSSDELEVWIHSHNSKSGRVKLNSPLQAFSSHGDPSKVVFVNSQTLNKTTRGRISAWARKNSLDAIVLNRGVWTQPLFIDHVRSDEELPYQGTIAAIHEDDDIEWVDPADIAEEMRPPRKPKAAPITLDDEIRVINGFKGSYHRRTPEAVAVSMTGRELVERVKSTPRARLVTGTTKDLREEMTTRDLGHPLVYAVATGEKVLPLVVEALHPSRVKSITQHLADRDLFLLNSLTPAQKRRVADLSFRGFNMVDTTMLKEVLSDDGVQVLDELMGLYTAVVTKDPVHRDGRFGQVNSEIFDLSYLARGSKWADEHTSMREFTPVLHTIKMLHHGDYRMRNSLTLEASDFTLDSVLVAQIEKIVAARRP